MTTENTDLEKDETAGFVTSTSDYEQDNNDAQEEPEKDGEATPENEATEADVDDQASNDTDDSNPVDDATADTEKTEKSNGVQKRIDKVIRQREDEKRKREAVERELAEFKAAKEESAKPKEPVESDFETYDEYLTALDKFDESAKQEAPKEEAKKDKQQDSSEQESEPQLTDSQKSALGVIQERLTMVSKPDDFDAVALNPDVSITGDMLEGLAECDNPEAVMYHLGKNMELANEISGKTPAQQMREIAKLDLTVKIKPPKPAKTTNSPDPINPVRGADSSTKSVEDMSFSEYEAHMNAQERGKKSTW